MKKAFLDWSMKTIQKQKKIDDIKLSEIKYGLESLYLSITKLIIILIISLILGLFKELVIFLLFYNIIRLFAFGLHAPKSSICLLASLSIFISLTYISVKLMIPLYIKLTLGGLCLLAMIIYAPADTKKRPLVNSIKRKLYKRLAIIISLIYIGMSIFLNDSFLTNCLILSLLIETILILPITYKTFNQSYNNYLTYLAHKT